MIQLAIIEDESKTRALLRAIITEQFKDFKVVGEADSVRSGMTLIMDKRPQVILLDVELGDGNAFDLLARLTHVKPHVIFVTAYDYYAIEAIRNGVVDYIEKPIHPEELENGLNRVKGLIENNGTIDYSQWLSSVDLLFHHKIAVPTRTGTIYLEVQDIVYVKADSAYSEIHFDDGRKPLIISRTLKEVQHNLEKFGFVRPHRSYLINTSKIKALNRTDGGNIVLTNDFVVPFSRQYKLHALQLIKAASTFL